MNGRSLRPSVSLFVTLEGIDGAGKTVLAQGLRDDLRDVGVDAVLTEEPTGSWSGDAVRQAVEEGAAPRVQALLFLADRALHIETIREWLDAGRLVLCDRYHDSTLAYQGVALREELADPRGWLNEAAGPFLLEPDLTFLLLVEPEEALRRVEATRSPSPFERADYLAQVQDVYRDLAKSARFVVLDANRSPEAVRAEARERLLARIQP